MKPIFILIICATSTIHASAGRKKNCDKNAILFYEDLGCTVLSVKNGCPSSYDCGSLVNTQDTCIVRRHTFRIDDLVDSYIENPSCQGGCFCAEGYDESSNADFICAIIDCIEDIGPPLDPGCYWNYSRGGCCSSGQTCPPFDDLATCEYEGVTYLEGQRIQPSDSCYTCVCLEGFTGELIEPFCRRPLCGTQLNGNWPFRLGCAPLYYGKAERFCCPNGFICPSDGDVISDRPEECKGKKCRKCEMEATCKFGDRELVVGQTVKPSSVSNVFCECKIPPFLTCLTG